MEKKKICVLIIEDEPAIAKILKEFLAKAEGFQFEAECVERLKPGLDRLARGGIDIILLDLGLPDSKDYDSFLEVKRHAGNVPIIVITGMSDDALAMKAIQEGAQDYLVKGQLDVKALPRTIAFAIERSRLSRK